MDYPGRKKHERGVLLRYLQHISGYSRAQVTRLVSRWRRNRLAEVPLAKRYRAPAAPFARKCTALDVGLLVERDQANEDVCGPAIAHLLLRAYQRDYDDPRYERLATLSVSHRYHRCKSARYQAQRLTFTKTRPVCNAIGVRKALGPEGRAGFVRIDTVHQGDQGGVKGVYHITCVDAVSQWQVEACVQGVSAFDPGGSAEERVTLKPGITLQASPAQAQSPTDLAAAQAMQCVKRELFSGFVKPQRGA